MLGLMLSMLGLCWLLSRGSSESKGSGRVVMVGFVPAGHGYYVVHYVVTTYE